MGPHSQPHWWLLPPAISPMSAAPAPPSPGLSAASVCSFRLSHLIRVHAGLVSHSTVRPHQGAVVERIIAHPLYSAQNHDYDVALLRLRTPLHFSGEAASRGGAWRVGATRVPKTPPCCELYNGHFIWGPSWTLASRGPWVAPTLPHALLGTKGLALFTAGGQVGFASRSQKSFPVAPSPAGCSTQFPGWCQVPAGLGWIIVNYK